MELGRRGVGRVGECRGLIDAHAVWERALEDCRFRRAKRISKSQERVYERTKREETHDYRICTSSSSIRL